MLFRRTHTVNYTTTKVRLTPKPVWQFKTFRAVYRLPLAVTEALHTSCDQSEISQLYRLCGARSGSSQLPRLHHQSKYDVLFNAVLNRHKIVCPNFLPALQGMKLNTVIICVALCLGLTVGQMQLRVYRGTLVHSRVPEQIEVLQDHLLGFDENNLGEVSASYCMLSSSGGVNLLAVSIDTDFRWQ